MSTEDARAALLELERQRAEEEETLQAKRRELDTLLTEVDALDRRDALRKQEIQQARVTLEREEAEAASRASSKAVSSNTDELIEHFEDLADGKGWNDGIYDFQFEGAMFGAVARRWILGDGMGMGKTWTGTAWLDLIEAQRVVLVTEASLMTNFEGELLELAPHRTTFSFYNLGPEGRRELLDEILASAEGVVIINHELLRGDRNMDTRAMLQAWMPDTVLVDEAHSLKNTATASYKAVQELVFSDNQCARCGAFMPGLYDPDGLRSVPPKKRPLNCEACEWNIREDTGHTYENKLEAFTATKSVKNVLFMTGTPILNDPIDLYALLHLADPILFRTASSFREAYCTKNYHADKWEWRGAAVKQLKPLIEGRFLARTAEEVGIEIPKQHVHIVPVQLDPADYPLQWRTIRQVSDAAQIVLSDGTGASIMHLMALITRKRQANVWPGGIEIKDTVGNVLLRVGDEVRESCKIDAIVEAATRDFEATHRRQVIFSQFSTALEELEARLSADGYRVARFDGSTRSKLREEIRQNLDRKNGEEAKWDFILCNYKTGGVGLNLTAAEVTHILDEEWNPGKRDQAYARTHRINQSEETEVYVYRIPRSIDTWMSNAIHRKERMIGGFTATMAEEERPNQVSVEALREAIKRGDIL